MSWLFRPCRFSGNELGPARLTGERTVALALGG
jgi:hypothetical protein